MSTTPESQIVEPASTKRQPLLPLFALALALMGVGFYASRHSAGPDTPTTLPPLDAQELSIQEPSALAKDGEPVLLANQASALAPLRYLLEQESVRARGERSDKITTTIQLVAQPSAQADGVRAVSFQDVHIRIAPSDQKPIAGEMTAQLEQVLSRARATFALEPSGQLKDYQWRSRTNPELEPSLRLIESAQRLLSPHFRRAPVRPGDVWSYDLPLAGLTNPNGLKAEGSLKIDNTFAGWMTDAAGERLAVIRQRLKLEGKLVHEAQNVELSGSGQGLVFFDVKRGQLVKHTLSLTQQHGLAQQAQHTNLRMSVSRQ